MTTALPRAALALVVAIAASAHAQPADVAAIQAREARNADARTLAALERFRSALVGRFGADPRLAMLDVSESEVEALVLRAGGAAPEHVIRQGESWISTDARRLRAWVPPAVAAANAFALSQVRAAPIRAWQEAWRKVPGQATDFVTNYTVGYDPSAGRVVVRAQVGSMTTGALAVHAFDIATGAPLALPAPKR